MKTTAILCVLAAALPSAVGAQTYYEGLRTGNAPDRRVVVLDKDSVKPASAVGADLEFDLIFFREKSDPAHRGSSIERVLYNAHCEQRYGVQQRAAWIDKDGSDFDPDFTPSVIRVGAKGTDTGKLFDAVCHGDWSALTKLPSGSLLDLRKTIFKSGR